MKTLDEVIRAVQHCGLVSNFDENHEYDGGCPYEDCSVCEKKRMLGKDIIHYLMEYREITDVCHKHGITSVWGHLLPDPDKTDKSKKLNFDNAYDNDPLTWQELKQMEGKPVWVEYGIDFQAKHWIILPEMACSYRHDRYSRDSFCLGVVRFYKDDIGKEWQAYRKERTDA